MTSKSGSLRSKIIAYSLSITFSILVLVITPSFFSVSGFLRRNLIEATHYRLRIAIDSIDSTLQRIGALADWASLNQDIINYLSSPSQQDQDSHQLALTAHRALRESMYAGGYDKYIDKILIGDLAANSIQVGQVMGHISDYDLGRAWFEEHDFSQNWSLAERFVPAPFEFSPANSVAPILRRIYDYEAKSIIGFAAFAVNDQVLTDPLTQYDLEAGTRLFVAMGQSVYDISDRRSIQPLDSAETLRAVLTRAEGLAAKLELDGKQQTLVMAYGSNTGWCIAQTLPSFYFGRQNQVFASLLALVIAGMLILVLSVLIALNRTVNQPIKRINKRVNLIAGGDFSYDPEIESDNELGNIGRAINKLSKDLEALIAERLSSEKAKKSLEFKMLQSQINPHFLYNALNIIKWSASIQKADGIVEMTSALASLLRHAARGTDELVPLALELDLVRQYCTIQSYRSAGLFELEIDIADAELLSAELMKFTLQPLVENAIIHGIEPKGQSGLVRIRAVRANGGGLALSVYDNGVGIGSQKLERILEPAAPDKHAFNHIGLANVDERIKLSFGENYGLQIESVVGKCTLVTAHLPFVQGASSSQGLDAKAGKINV